MEIAATALIFQQGTNRGGLEMKVKCPPSGVYYDIPAMEYHAWDAISSTLLKNYAALPSTAMEPYIPSDDVNIGSAIHAYCLQGIVGLYKECVIGTHVGTSKAAVEAKAVLVAQNPFKTVLPATYGSPAPGLPIMEVLNGVGNSFKAHPKICGVLAGSQKEVSLVWIDTQSGCECKARLDVLDGNIIWDLKKTRDIDRFQWQMKDLEYYVQAGHYFNGATACGLNPVAFGFIPCEAVPPFRATCGYCDPDKLEAARVNAVRLVGLVNQSKATGNWPNYKIPDSIYNLDEIQPDDLVQLY